MDGHLSNDIKKDRARRLIEIDKDLQLTYNERFINKKVNVLIEEVEFDCIIVNSFLLFIKLPIKFTLYFKIYLYINN